MVLSCPFSFTCRSIYDLVVVYSVNACSCIDAHWPVVLCVVVLCLCVGTVLCLYVGTVLCLCVGTVLCLCVGTVLCLYVGTVLCYV